MSYPPIFTSDGITVDVNTYEEIKPVDFVKNWIYIWFNPWTNETMRVKITDIDNDGIITYKNKTSEDDIDDSEWEASGLRAFRLLSPSTKPPLPRPSRQPKSTPSKGGTKRRRNKKSRKSRRIV